MHIPDGYLSPSTCASLYAVAAPFWYVSLKRVKKSLNTRMVPLLSVFSAFCFVIMMFNLPLPGGTTGHAVGMGIAAIVLGPWASILAISVALLIQALFFGDGGVTAIGANCFNMAIVGSLVAYAVYRAISRRAPLGSTRRVVAAGIAGYAAINVAALFAAVEFGIQPLLFRDASGAPLYAPYPLSVSIPAMLIGHLTFAGLAELIISAGIVAYLQRTDLALLRTTAPDAPDLNEPVPPLPGRAFWPTTRKLWIGIAALIVLTPLGIFAVGTAWGEWSARDVSNPQVRHEIAAASRYRSPPAHAPEGLERLSALWRAPMSGYAPSFVRSASFGYFVSAMAGVGLVVLLSLVVRWLVSRKRSRRGFIEKTTRGLFNAIEQSLFAEEMAQSRGFLQSLDARVKLAGMGALILASVAVHRIEAVAAILVFGVLLAFLSHVPIRVLATRVWIAVLAFTGVIALPAVFLTPGHVIYQTPILGWAITSQGIHSAVLLILRAEAAATLSVLLILCTLWTHLLRALRLFHVPVVLVVVIGMTYRYIFLFLQTARDMLDSREARMIGTLEPTERRRLAAASAGVLLGKSLQLSGEVHMAMQARGFRGEARLLEDLRMRGGDWTRLAAFACVAAIAVWLGR